MARGAGPHRPPAGPGGGVLGEPRKEVAPVTIATYQVLITRQGGRHQHLDLLGREDWGLIVYDEVHLLPAPVFRMTAEIQARRRLGLTCTLVREDGREADVFNLIGPKRYDAPWRDLEAQGWVAAADCVEVEVDLTDEERMDYALAEPEERYRRGGHRPLKLPVVASLAEARTGPTRSWSSASTSTGYRTLGELLEAR